MNSGRNLKYSGEKLAVAISQLLGALSDSKYIGDTWNFVFETAPSADKCMSALIILPKVTFKRNLERKDRLLISKIHYFQPILANCRVDITIFIPYMGLYWMELVGVWCRISSSAICCYPSPDVTQPYQP